MTRSNIATGDGKEVNNDESTNYERFHVITGGPGSGKTSLLNALRSRGYNCSVEAGRGIIQDQVSIAGRRYHGMIALSLPS